ncbi:MAG: acetylglutamate kinase [Planctomycetota bacterium]
MNSSAPAGRIVVKVGGAALNTPEVAGDLWQTLAGTAAEADLIVVHGGGVLVDKRLADAGRSTHRVGGLRVTPREDIGLIADVLAGDVNRMLVGLLKARGVEALGMGVADAGLCVCEQLPDLGRTGTALPGNASSIHELLATGTTPVVHCIGAGADGEPLNINADAAAIAVANTVGADRLVLLSDVSGVLDDDGDRVPSLDADSIDALTSSGVLHSGMIPKAAAAAAFNGSSGAVIGSWQDAAAILGGAVGVGTRVLREARRRPAATT